MTLIKLPKMTLCFIGFYKGSVVYYGDGHYKLNSFQVTYTICSLLNGFVKKRSCKNEKEKVKKRFFSVITSLMLNVVKYSTLKNLIAVLTFWRDPETFSIKILR